MVWLWSNSFTVSFLSHYIWHFWNWVLLYLLCLWKWSREIRLNRDVEATGEKKKRKEKQTRRKVKLKCYFGKWLLWWRWQTIAMQVNYWPIRKVQHGGCATHYWSNHSHKSFPQGNKQAVLHHRSTEDLSRGQKWVAYKYNICLWSFHTLSVDLEKALPTHSGKGMGSYCHKEFLCVKAERTLAFGGYGDRTAHCYTVETQANTQGTGNTAAHSALTSEIVLLTKSLVGIHVRQESPSI